MKPLLKQEEPRELLRPCVGRIKHTTIPCGNQTHLFFYKENFFKNINKQKLRMNQDKAMKGTLNHL